MSLRKLLDFLNRDDLDADQVDRAFETVGRDLGPTLGARLIAERPALGYADRKAILAVHNIGPKRLQQMLKASARSGFPNLDASTATGGRGGVDAQLVALQRQIRQQPQLVPSFRAALPLGLTDAMGDLVALGTAAIAPLTEMLSDDNPRALRKAAVVMLGRIDSAAAEALVVEALDDPATRAEALVVLPNYEMRNPDGAHATEFDFLFDPDAALRKILPYIDDETEVTLESGFVVYRGPVADLALGAAARLVGQQRLAGVVPVNQWLVLGLIPQLLAAAVKAVLQAWFRQFRAAVNDAIGLTGSGKIFPSEKDDFFTLAFEPKENACPCDQLAWIQIARAVLPDGTVGYAEGEVERDSDKDGWLVDRLEGRNNPVYGAANGSGAIPAGKGQYGSTAGNGGAAAQAAKLTDRPGGPIGTRFEFESCVFCLDGDCAGQCYGCYLWSCQIDLQGKPTYKAGGAADKPSAQFSTCAREWNKLAGKIDTPDPDKW